VRLARARLQLNAALGRGRDHGTTGMSLPTNLIERLDGWVNELAAPLMPRRFVPEGSDRLRLEFREHIPHAVMIGKLVRAVTLQPARPPGCSDLAGGHAGCRAGIAMAQAD